MGGATAIGASIGVRTGGPGSPWPASGAILDADFTRGRFSFAGRSFASKSAFFAAVGGSEASGAVTIGPYVAPDGPELITNGSFGAGTAGWTTTQVGNGPATGAVVGGEYVVTGNAANTPFAGQAVAVAVGRAYLARGKIRGAGAGFGANFWITPNTNGAGFTGSNGAINTTTGLVEAVCSFATIGAATTMHIGARSIFNPANGSFAMDDYSCKECTPFAGFVPMAISGVIEATTPAAASGNKVLWQTDDGAVDFSAGTSTERNYVRLYWDASRHLHLLVVTQATIGSATTQADLDLGVIAVSTPFRVAFSAAPDSFIAACDGQPALSDLSGTFPGAAKLRIGRGQTTNNNWGGAIARVTLFAATRTIEEVENLAAGSVGNLIAVWGDSLAAGAGASSGSATVPAVAAALFNPDRAVSNQGLGGQTSTQIAARMNARPCLVSVAGDQLPASGSVAVTSRSINMLVNSGSFTGTSRGRLAGVAGVMSTDASGNWTFTRAVAGSAVACGPGMPFVTDLGLVLRRRTAWLWLGRNGAQSGFTVPDDVAAAIAYLGHSRYLVGAILPSTADNPAAIASIAALNGTLAATHGARFVDVLQALRNGNDGSPSDLSDIASGWTPRSLRSDAVHLNDAGYAVVAASFKAANDAMGW